MRVLAVLCLVTTAAAEPSVDKLGWLAGRWVSDDGAGEEEHVDGKVDAFDFRRAP